MMVLSFPLWIIFSILSPILMLAFVLGAGFFVEPALKQKPAIIEKYPS